MNADSPQNCPMRLVWDPVVRILHWWMAASLGVQFVTGAALMLLDGVLPESSLGRLDLFHYVAGGVFATGLAGRLVWLFVGPAETGWRDFLPLTANQRRDWLATLHYYLDRMRGRLPPSRAHNPFAASVYLAFFAVGTAQVVLGIALAVMDDEERMHSPLLDWHTVGFYLLLLFVLAHLSAVVIREIRNREGLVSAMIHGYKPDDGPRPPGGIS